MFGSGNDKEVDSDHDKFRSAISVHILCVS